MKEIIAPGLIGAGLFALGWFQRKKVKASAAWPSTTGTVLDVTVRREFQQGSGDDPDSYAFYPDVRYVYAVQGRTYNGNGIRFDLRGFASEKSAWQAVVAYPPGQAVQVFYDPRKPEQAVLERKNSAGTALLIIGGVFAGIAILALLFGR
jgi:hypothetical protein